VTVDRGHPLSSELAPLAFVTVHPSALLRAPDGETRHREMERFVADLVAAHAALPAR
jgi:DNA polymerase